MSRELRLQGIAARQHGLASRPQLLRLGFTTREITGRVARSTWARAAPRVYDVAPASFDPCRALHAAALSADGWASHRGAAWLLGYVDRMPDRPSVVIAEGRHLHGIAADVYRSRHLEARERTTVDGIASTSAVRTLLDLGLILPEAELDDAFGRGLVSGRITLRRVDRYLAQPMIGRRGAAALRAVVEAHRDRGAATQSKLEVIVSRAVAAGHVPAPRHQHPVTVGDRTFHLDLAWPAERVFLEADGFAYHRTRRDFLHDRERQNLLVVAGWQPLRYTWPVATDDPGRVVRQLRIVLAARGRRTA
jgi:very-short-patch-repair endonuclease